MSSASKTMRTMLASAALLLLAPATAAVHAAGPPSIQDKVAAAIGAAGLNTDATVAIVVREVATSGAEARIRSTAPMIPASNAKVLTAAAAWAQLGPEWRWTTTLSRRGALTRGTLTGDLWVSGNGDPTISARFGGGRATATLEQWAAAVQRAGVSCVSGDLVLDDRAFDAVRFHPDWPANQSSQWYSAEISALTLNDACIDLRLAPGGNRPKVVADPETDYIQFDNDARTTTSRKQHAYSYWRTPGQNTIRIWGKVWSEQSTPAFSVTVHDPGLYFGAVLREVLAAEGVTVHGAVRRAHATEVAGEVTLLARHRAPLALAVSVCLKRSQNLYAEHLCKTLGHQRFGQGTWSNGAKAIAAVLAPAGHAAGAIDLADGSGYSRRSRITADAMARVLCWMGRRHDAKRWREALAIPGEEGTLDDRLTAEPYRSNVWAKTGYINGVSALSGYAKARDGKFYAFSVLVNGIKGGARRAKTLQDTVAKLLVEHR